MLYMLTATLHFIALSPGAMLQHGEKSKSWRTYCAWLQLLSYNGTFAVVQRMINLKTSPWV